MFPTAKLGEEQPSFTSRICDEQAKYYEIAIVRRIMERNVCIVPQIEAVSVSTEGIV